ncbi:MULTISPECIES: FAD binding domain-containing protein [Paenibacillus]|uniref:Xanthine dehydrogenase n=1 Tax=Paenibacillus naphthalenovorans TaxID=162209 RepID=A0A0U2WCM4_9BACL|nr:MULTISPECIES: FAD binding domain-containing protein [Paenibacillus]ALS24110.1 xanthine dehydrogenase [Paenibacillus naphthalenovorans]GCL72328.1 xanthine dehydrogenase [Paenibacillus naphthalenovorans]
MIPYNFEYYQPVTALEGVRLFHDLALQGKEPMYYAGGTEIITMGRTLPVQPRAVIDIKKIPECTILAVQDQKLVLGSALSLSRLHDSLAFPLLGETAAGVADRTSRNKITLGGNICSRLMYRETVLPLLLTDSEVRIAGPAGWKQVSIHQVFHGQLQLEKGEFLVHSLTDSSYIGMPYAAVKKRKVSDIGYPLLTVAAIRTNAMIRVAFSGVCAFPFRSPMMEDALNRRELPLRLRIEQALVHLPAPILDDFNGSAAYREWVLKHTLLDTILSLEGESHERYRRL